MSQFNGILKKLILFIGRIGADKNDVEEIRLQKALMVAGSMMFTFAGAFMVDFTPMSTEMSPTAMVDLLNEIFTHFDGLVEQYDLEKIKTVGDCYMVAAGAPRPRIDHAQIIVKLALDMLEYVSSRDFHASRPVNFRIGINTGPVLAGVIGRKKFIYDLWGDTVNTASRMESHGQCGTIQITRETYEAIKDEFVCEPRGTVNVKGKGEMEVWLVLSAKRVG